MADLYQSLMHVRRHLEPLSLIVTAGWTALFLAGVLFGCNPARGFVAATGKGE